MSTDTLTKEERSKRMSLVKSKDTKSEIYVRKLVHGSVLEIWECEFKYVDKLKEKIINFLED